MARRICSPDCIHARLETTTSLKPAAERQGDYVSPVDISQRLVCKVSGRTVYKGNRCGVTKVEKIRRTCELTAQIDDLVRL